MTRVDSPIAAELSRCRAAAELSRYKRALDWACRQMATVSAEWDGPPFTTAAWREYFLSLEDE